MSMHDALRARIDELAAVPHLLVALDFDGTVAPIVARPEDAVAHPVSARAVRRLAALPDTAVAYVSGRSLDSLRQAARPPENVLLVGSHGAEVDVPGLPTLRPLTADEETIVDALDAVLKLIASAAPGSWVEQKPYARVLHTRQADPVLGAHALRAALESVGRGLPGVVPRRGKRVVEFSIRSETKGDALRLLRARVHADAVFFAGDDTTDEDAFAVLSAADLGVHCGDGETRAGFTVPDPDAIAEVLDALAAASPRRYAPVGSSASR